MNWNNFNSATTSLFVEVMNGKDKNTFNLAYTKGNEKNRHMWKKIGEAREYVALIFELFADRVSLPTAQAKQLVELGRPEHYRVICKKLHVALIPQRQELFRNKPKSGEDTPAFIVWRGNLSELDKQMSALEKVVGWDSADLNDYLRGQWVNLLSIEHHTKRHDITGKLESNPAQHKPQKKSTHTVETKDKRPKFKKGQKKVEEHNTNPI